MPDLKKPSELMKVPIVKRNFKTAQQIGFFVAVFGNGRKFYSKRVYPTTVLIDKSEFVDFLKYVEKYK
jgi:formylmethanofuran:tetrahydromethanopterin formyltransferase